MKMSKVIRQLSKERARLAKEVQRMTAALTAFGKVYSNGTRPKTRKRRKISAAGRKRIAAAQRARWAKIRAKKKAGQKGRT
jgi:hypothetical protein